MAIAQALHNELSFGAVSRRERPLSVHIPYARHVSDQVIRTDDGVLLSTLKLDGFCFETADISDINVRLLARNDLVRTLGGSRYAITTHIIRREVTPQLNSDFESPLCAEIDGRYSALLAKRRMFVNDIYVTILRRGLQGSVGTFDAAMKKLLGRKTLEGASSDDREALNELEDVTVAIKASLGAYSARHLRVEMRDGIWCSEPLEFLIQIINGALPRPMPLPRMKLGEALAMKRVFFGRNALEIRGASPSDTRYGAMLSVREYPGLTGPGMLDSMLSAPHEFILSQSFAIVDKVAAAASIDRVTRQVDMSDAAGSVVSETLEDARNELLGSEVLYGQHNLSVLCLGRDLPEVQRCVTSVGATLSDRSVIWVREDLNLEPAFWSQLPGNFAYGARSAMISSKNFAGLSSLHNYPSGRASGNHWGPAISILETVSQTAYYFNYHVRDLGNFTVVGPSGSGKTVFLGFMAAQSQRIKPRPKLVLVDKDRGMEILVRALGGQYEVMRPGEPTGFNPLQLPDNPANREFLFSLISFMVRPSHGGALVAVEEKVIRNAIASLMGVPIEGRTLSEFATLLRGRMKASDDDLFSRLGSWIRTDQRGWLFNNPTDSFSMTSIFGFDMTAVLDDPVIRTAALMYIFHRIEELLDGTPVMIFLDEGWRLLDDEVFAYFIKDKLKTIRKQNGIIGFGTQSAADIVRSKSAATLIEQTATNIFFPNPKADDTSYGEAFRLTKREVRWIRENVPESRSFLIKHGTDSVVARLNLSGMNDLIKILSGRTETVAELDGLRARVGDDPKIWLPLFLSGDQP
ncbi:MAG: VirB4 family type IV secretion system protein [Hyphomicrobiales bacterium]|nr:VirB4 family type IV secretion system protein [Hyphomicrobiales bacterium]MDE2115809.1 VirB4 family type IV secretion system protein [Hyphomicrobiales bacterium]